MLDMDTNYTGVSRVDYRYIKVKNSDDHIVEIRIVSTFQINKNYNEFI